MTMITETIYAGLDNVFSLQLIRGGLPVNLLSITGYKLVLSDEDPQISFEDLNIDNQPGDIFFEKEDGIVEIFIGTLLTDDQKGRYRAYLITFDPDNPEGIRWPFFYLKVA